MLKSILQMQKIRRAHLLGVSIALTATLAAGTTLDVNAKYSGRSPEPTQDSGPNSWQDEIGRAKSELTPLSPETLSQAKTELVEAHHRLGVALETGTKAHADGWKSYLLWEEVGQELDATTPKLKILNEAELKVRRNFKGLELSVFTRYREALSRYRDLQQLAGVKDLVGYFEGNLSNLETLLLETSGDSPDTEKVHRIGRITGYLETAGQAPSLVTRIRRRYSQPNVTGWVSERFVNARFAQPVNDTTPVSETILGTYQRGTAYTTGSVHFSFIPNHQRAQITAQLMGQTQTQTVGTRPFGLRKKKTITIHSRSHSPVNATKTLFVDSEHISSLPAEARCTTQTTIQCIDGPQLLSGIISSEVHKKKAQAEWIASRRTERQIREGFDQRISQAMAGGRLEILEEFRALMTRMGSLPESVQVSTTSDHLLVNLLQKNSLQLSTSTLPPPYPKQGDFGLQLHESALNNFMESLLGGKTFDRKKLVRMIAKRSPESLSGLEEQMGSEDWSIRFPQMQPVTISFSDNQVVLTIRGDRFTRDGQTLNDRLEVRVAYEVRSGDSGILLSRIGDVSVDYTKPGRKSAQQVAFRSFANEKFSLLFPERVEGNGFALNEQFSDQPRAQVVALSLEHGWAQIGWELNSQQTGIAESRRLPGVLHTRRVRLSDQAK